MATLRGTFEAILAGLALRAAPPPQDFTSSAHGLRGWSMRQGRGGQLSDGWWRRHPGARRLRRARPTAPKP